MPCTLVLIKIVLVPDTPYALAFAVIVAVPLPVPVTRTRMVVVFAVVDLIEPVDGTVAIDGFEEDHVIAEAVIPTRVMVASMSAPFIWVPTKAVVVGGLIMISVGEFTRIELLDVFEPS